MPSNDFGGPSPDEQYCGSCGEVIRKRDEICPMCGASQPDPRSDGKSPVVAALLAFFLGGLGAHKFYLGQVGMGVFYLCFSWTLIPILVSLAEGVYYLLQDKETFARKYA